MLSYHKCAPPHNRFLQDGCEQRGDRGGCFAVAIRPFHVAGCGHRGAVVHVDVQMEAVAVHDPVVGLVEPVPCADVLRVEHRFQLAHERFIDRLDLLHTVQGDRIRIVDYKSGGKTFALSDVLGGLNMQMLINELTDLFSSGEMTESEMDAFMYSVMKAYVEATEKTKNPFKMDFLGA